MSLDASIAYIMINIGIRKDDRARQIKQMWNHCRRSWNLRSEVDSVMRVELLVWHRGSVRGGRGGSMRRVIVMRLGGRSSVPCHLQESIAELPPLRANDSVHCNPEESIELLVGGNGSVHCPPEEGTELLPIEASDGVHCRPEEGTELGGQQCIRNGLEGVSQPCVERRERS